MKYLSILLLGITFSATASAAQWEFINMNTDHRTFEISNRHGSKITVSEVYCTQTDGYDSLYLDGYIAPSGRWVQIGKYFSGYQNVKNVTHYADDTLSAYMNFCARINRHSNSESY